MSSLSSSRDCHSTVKSAFSGLPVGPARELRRSVRRKSSIPLVQGPRLAGFLAGEELAFSEVEQSVRETCDQRDRARAPLRPPTRRSLAGDAALAGSLLGGRGTGLCTSSRRPTDLGTSSRGSTSPGRSDVARRLWVGLLPGASSQVARDRLADGFAQLARVIGERFGTDLGQRVIVRQAQVSEDERPQLIIEPGTGLAFPVEVLDPGEQSDIVLREIPQGPVPPRMFMTDRFAAVRDSAS